MKHANSFRAKLPVWDLADGSSARSPFNTPVFEHIRIAPIMAESE
jgi:hypothetical protein